MFPVAEVTNMHALLLDWHLHSKFLRHGVMKGSQAGMYLSPIFGSR